MIQNTLQFSGVISPMRRWSSPPSAGDRGGDSPREPDARAAMLVVQREAAPAGAGAAPEAGQANTRTLHIYAYTLWQFGKECEEG